MRTRQMAGLVDRQRLRARLERSTSRPVSLVIAGPGCGKSVALTQFLAGCAAPWLRYNVRPEHRGLVGFVRGFADVLASETPIVRAGLSEVVMSAQVSDAPADVLAAWIVSHLRGYRGIIAIDDLHVCQDDLMSVSFTEQVIEQTKDHVTWLIASRSSLHLPIARWIAYGDSTHEIGEHDLRFTSDEAQEAAAAAGVSLERETLDHLVQTTGGWATALSLAFSVAESGREPSAITFAARDLSYAYLADQVFRRLTEHERDLLLLCAVLPDVNVRVLQAADIPHARAMLERLRTRLHILSLADSRNADIYRFHDLFRDFLLHQLDLMGEDVARTIRCRAANALLESGEVVAALRLSIASGSLERIASILREHGFTLGQQGYTDVLLHAIAAFPEERRESDPVLLGVRGSLEILVGRYAQGYAFFDSALACVSSSDVALRALLVARASVCRFNLHQEPLDELEAIAGTPDLALPLQGDLRSLVAITRARAGRHEGLPRMLDELETIAMRIESPYAKATLLQRIGVAGIYSGEISRALRVLPDATRVSNACGMYRAATFTSLTLGSTLLLGGVNPELAFQAMSDARDAAIKAQEQHYLVAATVGMLDTAFLLADRALLISLLEQCDELGVASMDRGTVEKALAAIAAFDGRRDDALEHMRAAYETPHFNEYPLLGHALLALFALLADDLDVAVAASVAIASSPSPSQPFFEIADRVRQLVDAQHAGDEEPILTNVEALRETHYPIFNRLLRNFRSNARERVTLTPTEQSVLRALDSGKTPKDIAREQGCSVNTVRWHIRKAIEKFDCSGSAQAIRLARAQGLI